MIYAVNCPSVWVVENLGNHLLNVKRLIDCASSWHEPGLFFSKCSFNIRFRSVLYQFVKTFPGMICRLMPLKCFIWDDCLLSPVF